MYVIVDIAGKQFKVSEGASLKVPSLHSEAGDKLEFNQVMLADDGKSVKIGNPLIKGASVSATVTEHGRDRKILIYKKKRRKGYQRKNGHRQGYTLIEINKISLKAPAKKAAPAAKAAPAVKKAAPAAKKAAPKKTAVKKKKEDK